MEDNKYNVRLDAKVFTKGCKVNKNMQWKTCSLHCFQRCGN